MGAVSGQQHRRWQSLELLPKKNWTATYSKSLRLYRCQRVIRLEVVFCFDGWMFLAIYVLVAEKCIPPLGMYSTANQRQCDEKQLLGIREDLFLSVAHLKSSCRKWVA